MALDNLSSVQSVINRNNLQNKADIVQSSDQRPRYQMRIVLALDVASTPENPYVLSTPFNGFNVEGGFNTGVASAAVKVRLAFGSLDRYQTDNYTTIAAHDTAHCDTPIKQATLTWDAQPGCTMNIIFYLGIDYRSGTLGGTLITTNTPATNLRSNTLGVSGTATSVNVGPTATVIAPGNFARQSFTFYASAPVWVGDANVAPNRGILVGPGNFTIQNTSVIFAYSPGGSSIVSGNEEF